MKYVSSMSTRYNNQKTDVTQVLIIICQKMRWSWTEIMETPFAFVLDVVDELERQAKEQQKDMKRRR